MKVSVNDQELFTLSDIQKQVIKNDVFADIFDEDMNRRLQWVLMHKYEECFKSLKAEWDPKLTANGIKMIPTDLDEYAQLVFAQPNYKDRAAREVPVEIHV
jgi:hypothetical protein